MGSPQNPRARHRQKARRAKKNAIYTAKREAEVVAAAAAQKKRPSAAPVAKSANH